MLIGNLANKITPSTFDVDNEVWYTTYDLVRRPVNNVLDDIKNNICGELDFFRKELENE